MRSRHVRRMQERAQLLGPDGMPIIPKGSEEIPFIQWLPDGKSEGRSLDRGPDIFAQASAFINKGGRFSCCLFNDGTAQIVAGFPVKGGARGEMIVVADETVPNGPDILAAVDRVVIAAALHMDRVILGESQAGTLQ